MRTKFGLTILAAWMAASAVASADPFVGKWRMDVRRSKYPAGMCPTAMVIEMRPAGAGIWYQSDSTFNRGAGVHAQYTADYDGKPVTVMSTHGLLLPVSLKRINPRIVEASYTRGMQVFATSRREVSLDGRRMTITTVSKDASGKSVKTIGIYLKDESLRELKQTAAAQSRPVGASD